MVKTDSKGVIDFKLYKIHPCKKQTNYYYI